MVQPPQGPLGPVGKPGTSAGRSWSYMLSAFLIGWDRRMEAVRLAKLGLKNRKLK